MRKNRQTLQEQQQGQMRQLAVDMLRLLIDQEGEIGRIVDRRIEEMLNHKKTLMKDETA